jgi:hypothetical protein
MLRTSAGGRTRGAEEDLPPSGERDRWVPPNALDGHEADVPHDEHGQDSAPEDTETSELPQIFRRLDSRPSRPLAVADEPSSHRESKRHSNRDRVGERLSRPHGLRESREEGSSLGRQTHRRERDRLADRLGAKRPIAIEEGQSHAAARVRTRERDRLGHRLAFPPTSTDDDSPKASRHAGRRDLESRLKRVKKSEAGSGEEPQHELAYQRKRERLPSQNRSSAVGDGDEEPADSSPHGHETDERLRVASAVPRATMGLRSDSLFPRAMSAGAHVSRHSRI